jgi:PAS domain S-box-containing protein
VAAAVLAVELLSRSPIGFRAPGLVLYPLVLLIAYRSGVREGLLAAALSLGYLLYYHLGRGEPLGPPDGEAWRLGVVGVGTLSVALGVGHLRDRFDQLLERERAARIAAEQAEQRMGRIVESISDGFVAVDHQGRGAHVNRAAEALLGSPRSEVLGRDVRSAIPNDAWAHFYEAYERAAREAAPVRLDIPFPGDAWLEVDVQPSADGMSLYFRDVTERREREERLRSMSLVDELTGAYNRRGFFTLADQQCRLAERNSLATLPFRLSVSVGTATFQADDPCSVQELVERADRAMYLHKRRTR